MGKLLDKLRRVQAGGRPFCTMIVLAAGSSARMGGGDKLMMELEGVPVLVRTLRALDAAQLVPEENILILYDRALMDDKAYVTDEEFAQVIARFDGRTEERVLANYDLVLHLITCAPIFASSTTTRTSTARSSAPCARSTAP